LGGCEYIRKSWSGETDSVFACECVCVCVREREGEREKRFDCSINFQLSI